MSRFVLFDLDNTLVDSLHLKTLRDQRRWSEVYQRVHTITTFGGIADLWNDLRAHDYHVGIVTHSPRTYAKRVLDHIGLAPDLLVAYHDLKGNRKPSPFGYRQCSAGRPPNRGIAIGDERNDLLAADAFGCAGVFAGWRWPSTCSHRRSRRP
jgi:phosphoglycolate phosphatase-like HAD superfamily hydrolase